MDAIWSRKMSIFMINRISAADRCRVSSVYDLCGVEENRESNKRFCHIGDKLFHRCEHFLMAINNKGVYGIFALAAPSMDMYC